MSCIFHDTVECNNKVSVNGKIVCNDYINKLFNLTLNPSSIKGAGIGLFAGKYGFKKGDVIGEYSRYDIMKKGKEINCSKEEFHSCYEYLYGSNFGKYFDARFAPDVLVRYANDARNQRKNNAYFDEYGRRVFMVASKKIKPYAEIFCDYGPEYDWSFLKK